MRFAQDARDAGVLLAGERLLDQWQRAGIGREKQRLGGLAPHGGIFGEQVEGTLRGLDRGPNRIADDDFTDVVWGWGIDRVTGAGVDVTLVGADIERRIGARPFPGI